MRAAERNADPVVGLVLLAVLLAEEAPAAVALAEILGEVGQLDQLVGIDVRVLAPAEDDVGAGAGVGGDGRLLADVLPADEVDLVSMPVACANLAVLARKITSSGSTKRAGRSMRSVAPFSIGSLGAATSARGIARSPGRRSASRGGAARAEAQRVAPGNDVGHVLFPPVAMFAQFDALAGLPARTDG